MKGFFRKARQRRAAYKAQLALVMNDLREEKVSHQRTRTISHEDLMARISAEERMREATKALDTAMARIRELEYLIEDEHGDRDE